MKFKKHLIALTTSAAILIPSLVYAAAPIIEKTLDEVTVISIPSTATSEKIKEVISEFKLKSVQPILGNKDCLVSATQDANEHLSILILINENDNSKRVILIRLPNSPQNAPQEDEPDPASNEKGL